MGYNIQLRFSIHIHSKDRLLLQKVATCFSGVGHIDKGANESSSLYWVSSLKDIVQVIIPRACALKNTLY